MNRPFFKIAVWCGVFFLAAAVSAYAAGVKIGVIDIQKIMQNSKAAKEARGIFLMDLEAKRAVLREKQGEVRNLETRLRTETTGKSSSEMKESKEIISREIKELRRLKSDLEEDLKKKDAGMSQKLLREIRDVVNAYSKKHKYTLILEKKSVVASADAIDITDEIIRQYDAEKRKK